MPFNEQLVRTLRAVRDSLDSDGVSTVSVQRALQSACNVERDSMIAAYADRVSCRSAELFRHVAAYAAVPGIDRTQAGCVVPTGWDSVPADLPNVDTIPADLPTMPRSAKSIRSPRNHAERNGMV